MEEAVQVKGIKLQDVAKQAGVSPATVTRVLHANGYVSEEKRALVEKAIQELGYTPRASAVSVQANQSPKALLFTNIGSTNPLFSRIAQQIGYELQQHGWPMMTHYVSDGIRSTEEFLPIIEDARRMNLGGVIFNCMSDSLDFMPIRRYLVSLPVPVVMIERTPDIYGINKILLNSEESTFNTVKYLAHLGHRKILFVGKDNGNGVENSRIQGFRFGASAMEIADTCAVLPATEYEYDDGYDAIRKYVEAHGLPTAIIAADPLAVGILHYLHSHNHRVPEDVSLISLDDTHSLFTSPKLTSVAFPIPEIAQHTARILREAQVSDTLPQTLLLSTKLMERKSVAPPRKEP